MVIQACMPQYLTPSSQGLTGPTSRVLLFPVPQCHSSVKLSKELEGVERQGVPGWGVGKVGEEEGLVRGWPQAGGQACCRSR